MDRPDARPDARRVSLSGILRRRWTFVLVGGLIGLIGACAYLLASDPPYRSTASVLVTPVQTGNPADALSSQSGRDEVNLDTEAQLVTSTATVERARELLGSDTSEDLVAAVTTNVPPNTAVLEISFQGSSPAAARDGAQAFANAYLDVRRSAAEERLNAGIAAVQTQFDNLRDQLDAATARVQAVEQGSAEQSIAQAEVSVLTGQLSTLTQSLANLRSNSVTPGRIIVDADAPSGADGPGAGVFLGGGLLLGLLLGVAMALTRERTDRRVRGIEDVAQLVGVPVKSLPLGRRAAPVSEIEPSSTTAGREFRRLSNELASTLPPGQRVIVVTAAGAQTDSAGVASNLAASLAQGGSSVTLVTADSDSPALASAAPGPEGPGLAEVMSGSRRVGDVSRPVDGVAMLHRIGPGRAGGGLSAHLQSATAADTVAALRRMTDFVVVHAPSASTRLDAQSLARLSDAAVVVVEAGRTEIEDLVDAVAQLRQVRLREVLCFLVPAQPWGRAASLRSAAEDPAPPLAAAGTGPAQSTAEPDRTHPGGRRGSGSATASRS
jgi:Mrp family chromosome partitioning ATPase/capsular polysaccharide biosynthesis protein